MMIFPNHGQNWHLYTCKAVSTTKQTMWLWHHFWNILPAWRIKWVKKGVRNESWHIASVSTIAQPWGKWWYNTWKRIIRVNKDDKEGEHLTHHVNDRIYGERGWQMSWVIVPKLDECIKNVCYVSHKKMSHRNIHQYQGEKHLGCHFHGILLFGISSVS